MFTVRNLLQIKKDGGLWAVNPETSTLDALRFMAEKNVGALVVLEDGILVGIISERDFVRRIAHNRMCDLTIPVQDYMTSKVITVTLDATIDECMKLMTDKRIRHLPVYDNGQLHGLISIGDVVKGIIDEQSMTIDDLEKYITNSGFGR
jgi:CBS domain-containing protein